MTIMKNTQGCDVCNKSALSLLLLRPSPIATISSLAPTGASTVISDPAATAGLLPSRLPTESRFALRLLRPGYVHVYIPAPPPGTKNWLTYRITEQADLVEHGSAWFDQPGINVMCSSHSHNAMGMKIIKIPQAHMISELWIAYSANLWNDSLRSQNKANPHAMQKIVLAGGSPNTFTPTASALKSKVLECALAKLSIDKATDHDFIFNSVARLVDNLAENLKQAASCHPKTKGKELAIVVRDPVGIATELNALRILRHELANKEIQKPENSHPLNSSNAVTGLKRVMMDANQLDSFESVSQIQTRNKFQKATWPPGTEWQALTSADKKKLLERASTSVLLGPYRELFQREDVGRVIYADHDNRAAAWAKKKTEESWAKFSPCFDEKARAAWVSAFEKSMKAQHYDPLAKFELDWQSAADDQQVLAYFKHHFDPHDPNDPLKNHSPGRVYAHENQYIHTPPPFTTGKVLDAYLGLLDKPITDTSSVVLRALAGNQHEVISLIHTQLTGDPGAEGMRDKTFDFMKGLGELKRGQGILKRYSWLGDGIAVFSVGLLSSFSGAVLSAAARHPTISAGTTRALGKMQYLWGIQQALELAVQGALQGAAPKLSILITAKVDVDQALDILRARQGQPLGTSKTRIKKLRASNTKISISILTDTDTVKAARGNVASLFSDASTGSVKMGTAAATAAKVAAESSAVILSEEQILRLCAQQSRVGTKAVNAVRQALDGASAKDARTIMMTMEGRLSIGSVIAQGLGLLNGLAALENAKSANEVRDAWYGIYDSTAGTLGGLLQMWAVAVDVRMVSSVGEGAAAKSIGLGALRFAASIAGVAGGVVNMVGSWAKEEDADKKHDHDVATLYRYSGFAFGGTAATSLALAAGIGADTLISNGVRMVVIESIAARVGASGVLAAVGGTALTVSGIGLVLLGAGIALQVGAIALTPTPMQRWISRSYFGKDPSWLDWDGKRDDMFAKGDWQAELAALQVALKEGGADTKQETPAAQPANAS